MNAERLLEVYEQISEAPDAIARLRQFVLDLAVRGKLVEQDSQDEPASKLLKRIAEEKAQLVKAGEVKGRNPIALSESATQLLAPDGWLTVPLGGIINQHLGGGTPSKTDHSLWDGDIPWESVKDIGKTKYVDKTIDQITQKGLENSSSNLIPEGNLIVVTRMGLGQLSINRTPVAINQDLRALFISSLVDIDFVYNFFLTYGMEGTGLTVKGIKIGELLSIPFPLPPLAEQHRIVAKIDELMVLCDRLEEARKTREETRDKLTAASLARLTAPDNTPEDFATHAAFALEALPALTTRPDQIKTLRQTILNLAVRGKLVEQDPDDETGPELLLRIQERKQKDVQPQEIKRAAKFSCTAGSLPFQIPEIWGAAALRELSYNLGDGLHGTPSYVTDGHIHFVNGTNLRDGRIQIFENTKRVSQEEWKKHAKPLSDRSILVSINGTLTNYAFYGGAQILLGKSACYFELSPLVDMDFIRILIQSPYYAAYAVTQATGTTIRNLSLKAVNSLPVPLPPLAEQHRIVAKVDALMVLCDRLEAALTAADTTRTRLLEAFLHEALKPASEVLEAA